MSFLERGLLGLHAGAWLSVLCVSTLSLHLGNDLNLLSREVGDGRWLFLLGWLALGGVVAALPTLRQALQLTALLTTIGLVALAALGTPNGGLAMRSGLGLLAAACLVSAALLARGRVRKARPSRPRVEGTGTRLRPNRPNPRRDGLNLAWAATVTALVSSFVTAWLGPDADLRGRGSILLLMAIFVTLPMTTLACWKPRSATLLLGVASVMAMGLYAPGSTALLLSLIALWGATAGAGLHRLQSRAC